MRNKGITLIALIITIIIMLILAGVTLNSAFSENGLFESTKKTGEEYTNLQKQEEEQLNELHDMMKDSNSKTEQNGKIKVNSPKIADGMIPIKYDEKKEKWIITNKDDEEWYDYSEGKMKWANVMLSDGKYKKALNNYKEDGSTEVEEQDLGSMFVWIPRYAYSFNKYHTEMGEGEGTTQKITNVVFLNGTSNKDYGNNNYERAYNPKSITAGDPTPMVVHPGFTFDNKELTGIWVAKFEASMSGNNPNTATNNKETKNTSEDEHCIKIIPNAETWRYISVGNSFFNCLNMNGENNIYGIKNTQVDTHLIKNIEWGVCSYLAASQYGKTPTKNDNGEKEEASNIYHAYSGENNYKENASQSTTGNVTGIYDMNGGSWEYVAGYYNNFDQNLKLYGLNVFKEITGTGIVIDDTYVKYWDKYEVGTKEKNVTYKDNAWRNYAIWDLDSSAESNQKRIEVTQDRLDLMGNKIGDAMYEVIKDYSYYGRLSDTGMNYNWMNKNIKTDTNLSWGLGYYNGDYTLIGNCARIFKLRGGSWDEGNLAGIFASNDITGNPLFHIGFRPAIVG